MKNTTLKKGLTLFIGALIFATTVNQNNDHIKASLNKEILNYIHGRGPSAPGYLDFYAERP